MSNVVDTRLPAYGEAEPPDEEPRRPPRRRFAIVGSRWVCVRRGLLKVTSKPGENTRGLVRFNLPAVPAGCQVTDVKLQMYNTSPKPGRTMQALQLTGTWTEQGVTWANQPATTGSAATATTPSSAATMTWNVTAQTQAMYAPGANHGFLIRDSVDNAGTSPEQQFHSREKAPDRPSQLIVTVR